MPEVLRVSPDLIEEVARDLYLRALKVLPADIQAGIAHLAAVETHERGHAVLATLQHNIVVAAQTDGLLCQDTGLPLYRITIGRDVQVDGLAMKEAIRAGCARATREHPFRSSVVHPLSRHNGQDSCGIRIPAIDIDFDERVGVLDILMIPKGSGSENQSWLKMALPADGVAAIQRFVIDCVLAAGGKACPPTVVGVGVGGSADLCLKLAKLAATRPLGSRCEDPQGAALEAALSGAVNRLGIGAQGLGGDATAFAVHIELAATHITLNPVAVNLQCHSARRARAQITREGVRYGD
ncbi:fumarate hydratase [uncultured Thiodictyon sp.]|uniref:fumarate hydratase n=1 Tax=uncultured Thiodictyon sp. TaxID=1846217 RepID=UPI0025F6F5B3|nr:fumarate hydratase [uncultured Thiodictyon sp.]